MRNGYFVIDSHCHIYPEKIAAKATAGTDTFYGVSSSCAGTPDDLLKCGTAAGIDRFIVQSVATAPKQVRSINVFISEAVKASDERMVGFGTLHPDSADMEGDVEHLISCGLKGVKLHPDIQGFDIDDPRCMKIYELCRGRLPILMHTGDKRYDHSNPNRLLPMLKNFPDLTVIGAHLGGWSIWEEASLALAGTPNLWVDCSSSFYALPKEKSKEIIRRYGAERVLFGTDYPMWEPEKELEYLFDMGLESWEYESILSKNVSSLLGL